MDQEVEQSIKYSKECDKWVPKKIETKEYDVMKDRKVGREDHLGCHENSM